MTRNKIIKKIRKRQKAKRKAPKGKTEEVVKKNSSK